MSITVQSGGENWVITPAPASPFGVPPRNIQQQQWLLTLTGVAILYDNGTQGVQGTHPDDWRRETVTINPDSLPTALEFVTQEFSIPSPAQPFTQFGLSVNQWAPYAAVSSGFHKGTDDAGFAVDTWRPTPFSQDGRDGDGGPLTNIFQGIDVDIAVRNNMAWIYRVSYQITLVGLLAYVGPGE
jgi:hypothetical protein